MVGIVWGSSIEVDVDVEIGEVITRPTTTGRYERSGTRHVRYRPGSLKRIMVVTMYDASSRIPRPTPSSRPFGNKALSVLASSIDHLLRVRISPKSKIYFRNMDEYTSGTCFAIFPRHYLICKTSLNCSPHPLNRRDQRAYEGMGADQPL
jgi:hypothetical protein